MVLRRLPVTASLLTIFGFAAFDLAESHGGSAVRREPAPILLAAAEEMPAALRSADDYPEIALFDPDGEVAGRQLVLEEVLTAGFAIDPCDCAAAH